MTVQEAQALFQAAKDRQPGAFARLYSDLFTPLYRYIILSIRHHETAEDLTQNLFVKALALSEKKAEIEFLPYLYRMAHNSVIDHVRRKKDLIPDLPAEETYRERPTSTPSPAEELATKEKHQELLQALDSLEKTEKDIIILRFFSELSHHEIALILEKSEANIRQIQSRTLKKLRSTHHQFFRL